jgi:Spy/CpxP family protein refolding chaperone
MKDKLLRFILVISLLLNVSLIVSAGYTYYTQTRLRDTPVCYGIGGRCFFEELSLTPGQKKIIGEKAATFHWSLDAKRREISSLHFSLLTLMRAEHPDISAIETVINRINGLQGDVQKMAMHHMLEMKVLLNKEQQKKFLDLITAAMKAGEIRNAPGSERFVPPPLSDSWKDENPLNQGGR